MQGQYDFNSGDGSGPGHESAQDRAQNLRLTQLEDDREHLERLTLAANLRYSSIRLRMIVLMWSFTVCVILIVLPYGAVWVGLDVPETLISQTNNLALVFIGYIGGIISSIFGITQEEDRSQRRTP